MDESAALTLPTPDAFPQFPFPPYSIQLELMKHLYAAVEASKLAILESPTGTGKTLSLICSALQWLEDDRERARRGQLDALKSSCADEKEPAWVVEQTIARMRRDLEAQEQELEERLEKARNKELAMRRKEQARVSKRRKLDHSPPSDDEDEDAFLPEDEPATSNSLAAWRARIVEDEPDPVCTKIYFASRTHTQLSQLRVELLKTPDGRMKRVVPLASRKNLCINDELKRSGVDIDEGCRAMLSGDKGKRCPYLPPPDELSQMLDFRDHILASPKDIEDLVTLGQELRTCPYFGSRRAVASAQIVTLPYNLLLQKSAREATGIDLKGHVVIIDEAHNLIDTMLSIHSVALNLKTLRESLSQLNIYHGKFKKRLAGRHLLHLRRLLNFLTALEAFCAEALKKKEESRLWAVPDLEGALGKKAEGINLLEIHSYLRASKLARKVSSYTDKAAQKENGGKKVLVTPPLHAVEGFITALSGASADGRIFVNVNAAEGTLQLKYQLLNPAPHFQEIINEARAVVLAGGTMSPISVFEQQLLPFLPPERLASFACGHVIPRENLCALVLSKSPQGTSLTFNYEKRSDKTLMSDLGMVLLNLVRIVPDGMVVFFPSYAFLATVQSQLKESGLWDKIGARKPLFTEPNDGSSVEEVLREYGAAIASGASALLLAVVGAKLSEGLNFSDGLARAVVLVGLPYANLNSPELKERMRFVREAAGPTKPGARDAGMEMYENMCMRAVNQSVGRAIRHKGDWAALIFVDARYGSNRVRAKLPGWISADLAVHDAYGAAAGQLVRFYNGKKGRVI
ncbi:DNA repair helicase [Auricularia subglabra TFB-10046 SS5]|nr:DNA repair helicase [Auricularia subglabra TFB-10046 SS5]